MKKFLMIFAVVGVIAFASSCKKCYNCSSGPMAGYEYCDDVYNAQQVDQLKTSCEQSGGTWTAK